LTLPSHLDCRRAGTQAFASSFDHVTACCPGVFLARSEGTALGSRATWRIRSTDRDAWFSVDHRIPDGFSKLALSGGAARRPAVPQSSRKRTCPRRACSFQFDPKQQYAPDPPHIRDMIMNPGKIV
jgi:hypothetical protein